MLAKDVEPARRDVTSLHFLESIVDEEDWQVRPEALVLLV